MEHLVCWAIIAGLTITTVVAAADAMRAEIRLKRIEGRYAQVYPSTSSAAPSDATFEAAGRAFFIVYGPRGKEFRF